MKKFIFNFSAGHWLIFTSFLFILLGLPVFFEASSEEIAEKICYLANFLLLPFLIYFLYIRNKPSKKAKIALIIVGLVAITKASTILVNRYKENKYFTALSLNLIKSVESDYNIEKFYESKENDPLIYKKKKKTVDFIIKVFAERNSFNKLVKKINSYIEKIDMKQILSEEIFYKKGFIQTSETKLEELKKLYEMRFEANNIWLNSFKKLFTGHNKRNLKKILSQRESSKKLLMEWKDNSDKIFSSASIILNIANKYYKKPEEMTEGDKLLLNESIENIIKGGKKEEKIISELHYREDFLLQLLKNDAYLLNYF